MSFNSCLIKLTLTESERKGNEIVNSRREGAEKGKEEKEWERGQGGGKLNQRNFHLIPLSKMKKSQVI